MKTTMLYGLILLTLLGVGIGCKKDVEEITGEPPLPPAGCQIVRTFYKNLTIRQPKNDIVEPETITLDDGSKVEVSLISTAVYRYDAQGRIAEYKEQLLHGSYSLNQFIYTPKTVIRVVEDFAALLKAPDNLTIRKDTVNINEQGLRVYLNALGQPVSTYNADNQLLTTSILEPAISNRYENGNLIEQLLYPTWVKQGGELIPTNYLSKQFSYNTERPDLPQIIHYGGRDSKNLPIKEVWLMNKSSDFANGPVYQKIFTYTYNKQGLVQRRVVDAKRLNPTWMIGDGEGVTDYEYKCP